MEKALTRCNRIRKSWTGMKDWKVERESFFRSSSRGNAIRRTFDGKL
jgi:hypothetical protein